MAQQTAASTAIPVTFFFAQYNVVKPNAFTSGLLSVTNNQVRDVPGRTQTPYLTNTIFAACPVKSVMKDNNFSLLFKTELFYQNSTLTVTGGNVDFGDGQGYRPIVVNTPMLPNYTTAGNKIMRFKVLFNNGSQYECYSPITIKVMAVIPPSSNSIFSHYIYPTSSHWGGLVTVRLSSTNSTGKIKKPLIVAEGFDPYSAAPNLVGFGDYRYKNFIDDIDDVNNLGYNFNQQLDNVGNYDIVFLDYNNGSDDIVRNAALLQEVITLVNAEKPINSTEQNVVLGISMGGLVARYALAKMTKTNIPTQTRLLITHDSPHHGANVPISLQLLILELGNIDMFGYKIKDVLPEYSEAKSLLNATATTQLLKYRAYENTIQLPFGSIMIPTITVNTFIDNIYKPMVTFLSSNLQPSYRFIATSQGAEYGTPLFSPGTQLLNIEANASGLFNFGLATGKAKVDIKAYALPAVGSTAELLKINVYAKGYLFGLIRVVNAFYNNTMKVTSSTLLPIDGATGGTSPIGSVSIPQQQTSGMGIWGPGLFGVYNAKLSTASLSNFCFVPTASALDVQNFNVESLTLPYINGISLANPSKAVNYITQKSPTGGGTFNESHTRFTAINSNWLFNEMQNTLNNTLNCSSNCSIPLGNIKIVGPSVICTNATYSIPNIPLGSTVTWSTTGGVTIVGSATANTVNIEKNFNSNNGTITATFLTSGCGNSVTTNNITIIEENASFTSISSFFPSPNYPYSMVYGLVSSITPQQGATYQWRLNGVLVSTANFYRIPPPSCNGSGENTWFPIQLTVTNSCGKATVSNQFYTYDCFPVESRGFRFVYSTDGGNGLRTVNNYDYTYYPNPANTQLTVSSVPTGSKTSEEPNSETLQTLDNKQFEVVLYDDKGKKLAQQKNNTQNKDIEINTQNIPNGIYFLHIFEGKEISIKQIVIQH